MFDKCGLDLVNLRGQYYDGAELDQSVGKYHAGLIIWQLSITILS